MLSLFRILFLVLVGLAAPVAFPHAIAAQDALTDSSLTDMFKQWQELDQELATKQQDFELANEADQKEDLRGQYQALLTKAEELIDKIRDKANQTLDDGTPDSQTSRLLMGVIMNDASFNRHNEAIQMGDKFIAAGGDGKLFELASKADRLAPHSKELLEELFVRYNQQKQDDLPQVKIKTSKGEMVVELFEEEAPNTVANFVSLVENKFYDGLKFHRVIEGFVAQGGDPNGDGTGGPGYAIQCECDIPDARQHFYGTLSMAHSGSDTGGSQFFICLDRTSVLDGRHTVFGRVVKGSDSLERLTRNHVMNAPIKGAGADTIESMKVVRKRDHDYQPVKVGDAEPDMPETPPIQPETMKDKPDSTEGTSEKEVGEEEAGEEEAGEKEAGEEEAGEKEAGEKEVEDVKSDDEDKSSE